MGRENELILAYDVSYNLSNKKTDTRPSCETTLWVSVKDPTYAGRRARSIAQIG